MGKIGCATVNESNPPKLTYPFGPIHDGSLWEAEGRVVPDKDGLFPQQGIRQVIDLENGIRRTDYMDDSRELHGLKLNGIPFACFKNNEEECYLINYREWPCRLKEKANQWRPIRNYVFSKFHARVSQCSESATVGEQLYRFNFSNKKQVQVFSNSPLSRKHLGKLAGAISRFPSKMFVLLKKGIFVADCLEEKRSIQTGETTGANGLMGNGHIFIQKSFLEDELYSWPWVWEKLVHEGAHVLDWNSDWRISKEIIGSDGKPLFNGGKFNPQEHIRRPAADNEKEDFAYTHAELFTLLSRSSVPLEEYLVSGSKLEIPFSAWCGYLLDPESPKVLSPKIQEKMQAIVELYRLNEDLTFQSSPLVLPDFSRRSAVPAA